MVFVCFCVHVMACICCLSVSLVCFVCAVLLFLYLFGVGMCVVLVVCCVAVCCFLGSSCVYVVLLFAFVYVLVGYGLNAFPVCDCSSYVPYLRCCFLFVWCCLFVYVIMV